MFTNKVLSVDFEMFLQCILLLALIVSSNCENKPVVKTKNGIIQGYYRQTRNERQFAAFEGIPYAEPPVEKLRFEEPVPKKPWTGVWNATFVNECMQMRHTRFNLNAVDGTEDCLYANVYTPILNPTKPLDVIVHIHGGAFIWGEGHSYGPNYIMDRDVIYVNFNYRLGPLGFLSTEDEILPGNMGLKDQTLALKWIKNNIDSFGGNPDSVTITGLSAGGASVHYHFISPLSKGLFERGIALSGSSLCNWAFTENQLDRTQRLGRLVGCDQKSSQDLVNCLRERPAEQIVQQVRAFQPWLYNPYSPFGPTVEKFGKNKFLPDHPYKLLKSGKVADVPLIISTTTEEGLYPAAEFIYGDEYLPYLEEHWNELAPHILHYEDTISKSKQKVIAQKIREFYLNGHAITRETFPQLVKAIGDRLFIVDVEKTAQLQAHVNKSPVYYYLFSYRGELSFSEYFTGTKENIGVAHADDLTYIISVLNYTETEDDKKMTELFLDMWTSFAKTGKPTIGNTQWKSLSNKLNDKLEYLNILSPNNIRMEKTETLGNKKFWDSFSFLENEKLELKNAKNEL